MVLAGLVGLYGYDQVALELATWAPLAASAPPPGDMGAVYRTFTIQGLPSDLVDPPA